MEPVLFFPVKHPIQENTKPKDYTIYSFKGFQNSFSYPFRIVP